MRTVVIHYHLFKNAGTSLDHMLRGSLAGGWVAYERPRPIPAAELKVYLEANPAVVAVSSHNATLPAPEIADARIVPVLFIRHPMDRARSVYDYESAQVADTVGARMAKTLDLRGYVEWRLDCATRGDATISDFQSRRLSFAGEGSTELDRALDALVRLPFVGLVEAYAQAIARLEHLLLQHIPGLRLEPVRLNATSPAATPLAVRLRSLRQRLGDDLYERLEAANSKDLAVWRTLSASYSGTWGC